MVQSTETSIADNLREATTVLDEEFHRAAVTDTLLKAADEIERLEKEIKISYVTGYDKATNAKRTPSLDLEITGLILDFIAVQQSRAGNFNSSVLRAHDLLGKMRKERGEL